MYSNNQYYGNAGYYDPNNYVAYGQPQPNGVNYAPQVMNPQDFTNPLSDEVIKNKLSNGSNLPKLVITKDALDRAICTHRWKGKDYWNSLPNGECQCQICGQKWHMVDEINDEEIQKCTDNMIDVLNTAKCMWLDVPEQVARDNFQVAAVVEQIPKIFSIATDRMKRYGVNTQMTSTYGQSNGFNLFNQIVGPSTYTQAYQQPMYNYQQAAPQYQQTYPNTNTNMQQQQMMQNAPGVSNGMGYTAAPPAAPQAGVPKAVPPTAPNAQQAVSNNTTISPKSASTNGVTVQQSFEA